MEFERERLWHLETWLREGKLMHRAGKPERISAQVFEEQRDQRVRYAVFGRVTGTFSDGCSDTRPGYKRLE